jgi:DNA repair exonuclease SbcCD nuclease subunit
VKTSSRRKLRFLHVSDVHLGSFPEDPVRRLDVAIAFDRAIALALDERVSFVVIAGDLFDKKIVSPDVLHDHARGPLERLRAAGIPVFAIEGNHDEPAAGARHSWVTYLGTEGLVTPLRPAFTPGLDLPWEPTADRPAGRALAPGGIPIYGLGYLGPRTDEVLQALPEKVPELGMEGPAIVLLHAMRSPVAVAEPGTFTDAGLRALAPRNVYLALGHGHRRHVAPDDACERPARFVTASPGSLEYIHETDFHMEDPRGALLVDVMEDGRFQVAPRDTVKRTRSVVTVDLAALAAPADLQEATLERCRAAGVGPRAILGVRLLGEPPFARAQLPLLALERRLREALAPVSLDVRFDDEVQESIAQFDSQRDPARERDADVATTLAVALAERVPGVSAGEVERLASFVAPRVGEGGAWRTAAEGDAELEDTLAVLLGLVAGDEAASVMKIVRELPWSS